VEKRISLYLIAALLLLFSRALPGFAEASYAAQLEKARALAKQYDKIRTQLNTCQKRAGELSRAGYGGTVLRQDLGDLAETVQHLKKELAVLGRELAALQSSKVRNLPDFKLSANLQSYDGPPVGQPLHNGDVIALQADVGFPAAGKPVLTFLNWQLFDAQGRSIPRYFLQKQAAGRAQTRHFQLRYKINNLPNGRYTAALTHQLASNPTVQAQARYAFEVYDPVRIKKLWVTDRPGGQEHKKRLMSGDLPHLYVAFEMAEGLEAVDMTLELRRLGSGKRVYSFNQPYTRKPDQKLQRRGLRLAGDKVRAGDRLRVNARIAASGGRPAEASVDFQVKAYTLAIEAPKTLRPGDSRTFYLKPPKAFKAPYQVRVNASGAVSAGYHKDRLKGTISAVSREDDLGQIRATVIDAENRQASAETAIRVKSEEKQEPPTITAKDREMAPSSRFKPAPPRPETAEPVNRSTPAGPSRAELIGKGTARIRKAGADFAGEVIPACLGKHRSKIIKSIRAFDPPPDEALRWGRADYGRLRQFKKNLEKMLLKDSIIPALKGLPDTPCIQTLLTRTAIHAQSRGLTYNAHTFAQKLRAGLKSKRQKAAGTAKKSRESRGEFAIYRTQKKSGKRITYIFFVDKAGLSHVTGSRLTSLGLCEGYTNPEKFSATTVRRGFSSMKAAARAAAESIKFAHSVGLGCNFWQGCTGGKWVNISNAIAGEVARKVGPYEKCR